ncbi:MAG TPA: hypothetical protein VGQ76_10175, partial [Thermoanaerobaculia bacterium]|nr:hypothetical protein [Thermoanaerobaculia bacterium]
MNLTRTKILILVATAIVAASCAPADVPPPAVTPQGEDRYLIDPRTGDSTPIAPQVAKKVDAAWRYAMAGNEAEAQSRLEEIRRTSGDL